MTLTMKYSNNPKASVAITAAKNLTVWGSYAAVKYARSRGVPYGAIALAIWCEEHERRQNERLPLFLLNQAG